jgi:hypothetical protein
MSKDTDPTKLLKNPMALLPAGKVVNGLQGLASTLTHGAVGGGLPQPPGVTPAPVMPLPDDQAVQAAKKKQLSMQSLQGGRASTLLTPVNQSDKLG